MPPGDNKNCDWSAWAACGLWKSPNHLITHEVNDVLFDPSKAFLKDADVRC